jgi:hypothetical protein
MSRRIVRFAALATMWTAFCAASVCAESIIDVGASEAKRVGEDAWSNYQFTSLLAIIAIGVLSFLMYPSAKRSLSSKERERLSAELAARQTKNEKKSDIEEDFAKVSELNYESVEDDKAEQILKAVSKGATWGALAGLVISQLPGNDNFLFGYYVRDGGLVVLADVGVGVLVGACAAWLYGTMPRRK